MAEQPSIHGTWTRRSTFVLAATGSAVGLGNIWKFPYMTGENGGGAFVLLYLVFIFAIGIPVMLAEILLGRRGRASPINTMHKLAAESDASRFWGGIGWMGAIAGMLILSFYSVVAGWSIAYIYFSVAGAFIDQSPEVVSGLFGGLVEDPVKLLGWHTLFTGLVVLVVGRGIHGGLEAAVRVLMPLLFVMLLGLLAYSVFQPAFADSVSFLFSPDFSRLNGTSVISALGHAFFTLSLGMGAIMAYGAYMNRQQNLAMTVVTIGLLDTLVAVLAGLVIFTIVFGHGMEPAAGPSLMFQTLPIAFSDMPGGRWLSTIFFTLVAAAAFTSAISLAEPFVAWAVEATSFSRWQATLLCCGCAWVLGIGAALSLNVWADWHLFGNTIFDLLDKLTTNILLPLGGLLICLFVGWIMDRKIVRGEVDIEHPHLFRVWVWLVRFLAPVGILAVMANKLLF